MFTLYNCYINKKQTDYILISYMWMLELIELPVKISDGFIKVYTTLAILFVWYGLHAFDRVITTVDEIYFSLHLQ
jgi:divalent metal cation (Fe/Co/Zn/Cd) transporter